MGKFIIYLRLIFYLYDQAVNKEEYPDDVYPTNCFGTFYVMSSSVRDKIYQVQQMKAQQIIKLIFSPRHFSQEKKRYLKQMMFL